MGCNASKPKETLRKNGFKIKRTKSFITSSDMLFRNLYVIEPTVLGGGSFGKVFRGHSTKDKNQKVAIKVIDKEKIKANLEYIKQECKSLNNLDHPNIIKYLGVFESDENIYIVMELCEGSDLFTEYCKTKDVMKEIDAAVLMKTIIKALIHCHANNIIHRDIKLENIMFKNKEITDYSDIQLIDFGLSKSKDGGFGMLSTIVGSPYFTAPEVFEGNYGKECDIWSCGVVLYVLLGGDYPYNADTIPSLYSKIQRKDPKFKHEKWGNISSEAKDLIKSMLNRNPDNRISFEKCLKHKWFDIIDEQCTEENGYAKEYGEVVDCLKKYNGLTLLK